MYNTISNRILKQRVFYKNIYKQFNNSAKITNSECKQNTNGVNYDLIGQPDQNSNLRPVKFYIPTRETNLQREYRKLREETQEWNQKFWSGHNHRFIKEREQFIATNKKEDETTLNADQMSVFYKNFLDGNWKSHVAYNIEWYNRNLHILRLSMKVFLEKNWLKVRGQK